SSPGPSRPTLLRNPSWWRKKRCSPSLPVVAVTVYGNGPYFRSRRSRVAVPPCRGSESSASTPLLAPVVIDQLVDGQRPSQWVICVGSVQASSSPCTVRGCLPGESQAM